jgi:UDP:flavonoid glycosyltransferase YjiC (YdhE family)
MASRSSRRILLAWELGANLGHVVPLLSLARQLRERGHQVVFALRDLSNALLIASQGFSFFPAPAPRGRRATYTSYAAMLSGEAFPSANAALAGALGWRSILQATRPDLMVADHAPLALLAARGLKLRVATLGIPFSIPVTGRPLPLFSASERDGQAEEERLLARLNKALQALRAPRLETVSDLYRVDATMARTLPETDCFAPRPDADYVSPDPQDAGDALPEWPDVKGPKVLVYLKSGPWVRPVCDALASCEASAIAYFSGIEPKAAEALERPGLKVAREYCRFSTLMDQGDAVVCHASHNTVVGAVLAGKPLVMMPNYIEQALTAARVVKLGTGAMPAGKPGAAALSRCLDAVRPGSAPRAKASRLAQRYAGGTTRRGVPIADRLEALVA